MAHESEPLVEVVELTRGVPLASSALSETSVVAAPDSGSVAAVVASKLVRKTTGKLVAARQDLGYLVDELALDKATWQGKIEGKIARLVSENPGLTPNDARINWAAKAEAFLALTKQYGFSEVDQYTDLSELSGGLTVAITESGSFVMFGPGTEFNGTKSAGDGRFAMTYMKGREGGKTQADGLVPPEVHVRDGAKGAKVTVFGQESVWNDAAGEYRTTDWEATTDAPSTNKLLEIDHDKVDKKVMEAQGTSRLLKVMTLSNPEDAEAIMGAFEGVSDAINKLTGSRAIRRPPAAGQAPEDASQSEAKEEEPLAEASPVAPALSTQVEE